jgi:hypothetical protein
MSRGIETPLHGTPEQLAAAGGIYYFEVDNPDQEEAARWVNIMGVELPTRSTLEQVEAVKDELVIGDLDALMLRSLAECYALRQPILLESDPSSGKTFLTEKFLALINGDEPQLSMAGTPRTSDHEVLGHYSPSEDGWKFVKGSLLEAVSGSNGQGRPLFVDEFGLIPSNYQQLFLPISGRDGSLAERISVWGNGDEQQYAVGPKSWFVFATNFPERTPGRHVVTDAMASRVVWMALTDEQTASKETALITSGFGRVSATQPLDGAHATPEQTPFALTDNPELAALVSEAVAEIHSKIKAQSHNPGDRLGSGEAAEHRIQPVDITPRDAARLFRYIERFPVRDAQTGLVDMTATLRRGFARHYLARFASPERRNDIENDITESLTGSTSAVSVDGRSMSREERFIRAQRQARKPSAKPEETTDDSEAITLSTSERLKIQE